MNSIAARLRKSRKPALLHLGLSATVTLASMLLVLRIWYPGEMLTAQGVSRLALMMIGVGVAIGPLITLIVFDPHKWGIRFDIAFIVTMQLLALGYGLYTIHGGRPVYVVFNVDRFDVVPLRDLDKDSLDKVPGPLAPSPWKPTIVAARLPMDPAERSEILFSAIEGGPDLHQLPEYYVPLEDERVAMLAKLHQMDELRTINTLEQAEWQTLLGGLERTEQEIGYLPLLGNAGDGAVILDRSSGAVVGIRMLTPRFGSPEDPDPSGAIGVRAHPLK